MRIIGGKFGGLVIQAPKGLPARPTTDRAREALFNILENRYDLESKRVLDLFAGTGGVGIEFYSRWASYIQWVETDRKSVAFIQSIAQKWDKENLKVKQTDVFKFIKSENIEEPFDFIFADPPYAINTYPELISNIKNNNYLKPGGLIILEHLSNKPMPSENKLETRVYGQSAFSFYSW